MILSIGYEDSLTCKICPDGWRVPYEEDWIDLIMVLGYANVAGGKMKIPVLFGMNPITEQQMNLALRVYQVGCER